MQIIVTNSKRLQEGSENLRSQHQNLSWIRLQKRPPLPLPRKLINWQKLIKTFRAELSTVIYVTFLFLDIESEIWNANRLDQWSYNVQQIF